MIILSGMQLQLKPRAPLRIQVSSDCARNGLSNCSWMQIICQLDLAQEMYDFIKIETALAYQAHVSQETRLCQICVGRTKLKIYNKTQ